MRQRSPAPADGHRRTTGTDRHRQHAGTSATSSSSANGVTLGGTDFLTLMLAQLQNQDPTSPVDSNEFLSQLASLSEVQGITQLNTSFSSLSNSLVSSQALQASSLLGHQALGRELDGLSGHGRRHDQRRGERAADELLGGAQHHQQRGRAGASRSISARNPPDSRTSRGTARRAAARRRPRALTA